MATAGAIIESRIDRRGGPNNLRHGLRSLAIGNVPKGSTWIKSLVSQFRRLLERTVLDQHGVLDVYRRCLIQSACRWEQHGLLAQRWSRTSFESLTHDQRLATSREIARASSERDKCLRELGLDKYGVQDAITLLYKAAEREDDSQAQDDQEHAADANTTIQG